MRLCFRALFVWAIGGTVLLSGCKSGNTAGRTVVGESVAGSVYAMMDEQRKELEMILPTGAIVESINSGAALKITFGSGILFTANSNTIQETSKTALRQFAAHLNNHPDTQIRITGHTDNTGRADFNQTLSERRARSVCDYLCEQGVDANRMDYTGRGFSEPVAANNTAEGRELNRRVEIVIEMAQNNESLSL